MAKAVTWRYQDDGLVAHSKTLLVGLNELRSKGQLLDITLQTEGKKFKAHRAVLSACSDYFRAMFTDPMKESRQSEISLNGVTATGIELLLDYAYTSNLNLTTDNVQEVLSGASHFQMDAVVNACSNYLDSQLDIENCVDIVTIAETYSLTKLRNKVYYFICGHLHEFSKTSELYRLAWYQLEHILACDLPVDCSETIVLKIVLQWIKVAGVDTDPKIFNRLLHHVCFSVIPFAELERTLSNASLSPSSDINYVAKNILERRRIIGNSNEINETIKKNIVNFRGMELALIKVGGFRPVSGITNKITYFLPSTKKWSYLTSIPHVDQCNYGTAVYRNELYIVGGCYNDNDSLIEYIHPFGFRYNPNDRKWATIAPMLRDRCRFSLNFVGNILYSVGGATSDTSNLDLDEEGEATAERYNPETDMWEYIQNLPGNRSEHAGASHENFLYISGGLEWQVVLSSFYRFHTKSNFWEQLTPMSTPRADHVMLSIGQKIFVCGGWHEIPGTTIRVLNDTIDSYDTETHTWEVVTIIPTPRYHAGIVAINSKIYVIGGLYSDSLLDRATSIIECYDLESNQWSNLENFPTNIWEHSCASLYLQKCVDS